MKKTFLFVAGMIAAVLFSACGKHADTVALNTFEDTLSWVLGNYEARAVMKDGFNRQLNLNDEVIAAAFANTISGKEPQLTDAQCEQYMRTLMAAFHHHQGNVQMQREQEFASIDQHFFDSLLAANPKVVKTESGICYEVLNPANGPKPKDGDNVTFDYSAYVMQTGEMFDNTVGVRDPIIHVLGKPMFEGLIQSMKLMNEGSKVRFYIPGALAKGVGGLPEGTSVIYEVELHKVN